MAVSRDRDRVAELIRELAIVGLVGDELAIDPRIIPTVSVGSIRPQDVQLVQPVYTIVNDVAAAPVAGTLLATTGLTLAAGTYDVIFTVSSNQDSTIYVGSYNGGGWIDYVPLRINGNTIAIALALALAQNDGLRAFTVTANAGTLATAIGYSRRG